MTRVAFRITYRISLRSSSSQEPRYPLLKVVFHLTLSWGTAAAELRLSSSVADVKSCVRVYGCGSGKRLRTCRMQHPVRAGRTCPLAVKPQGLACNGWGVVLDRVVMILPQVHLRKPCYDFTFL